MADKITIINDAYSGDRMGYRLNDGPFRRFRYDDEIQPFLQELGFQVETEYLESETLENL